MSRHTFKAPGRSSTSRKSLRWRSAMRANVALQAYIRALECRDDETTLICDLIADLGHLCDKEQLGLSFEQINDMALAHWRAERGEVRS